MRRKTKDALFTAVVYIISAVHHCYKSQLVLGVFGKALARPVLYLHL